MDFSKPCSTLSKPERLLRRNFFYMFSRNSWQLVTQAELKFILRPVLSTDKLCTGQNWKLYIFSESIQETTFRLPLLDLRKPDEKSMFHNVGN